MPLKDEIYQIWAPPQAHWSPWVKPVLFAFADAVLYPTPTASSSHNTEWVPAPGQTAVVVDLAGKEGVNFGLQLARLGYRPIPLYNALPWPLNASIAERPHATVAVEPILAAICAATPALAQMQLPPEAPPAFLLDADRRVGKADPGFFDNRSVCFPTDFPSAELLRSHGITQVFILQERGDELGSDLVQAMLVWQNAGIRFYKVTIGSNTSAPITLKPLSFLKRLWHSLFIALGLRHGELGGFGGIVRTGSG